MTRGPRVAAVALAAAAGIALAWLAVAMDRTWFEVHFLRLRCAVEPSDLRPMTVLRVGLGIAGAAILLALRRLDRWLARPGSAGAVLRVAAAVVLALLASDLLLRPKVRAGQTPDTTIQLPPVRKDPRYGWVLDGPRTVAFVEDGRTIEYAVDARGARVREQGDVVDPDAPTILFVGESVVFGLGVAWDEAYPAIVGRTLGVQVVDAGVHGYGDDQVYQSMLDRLADLRRPVAVVWLTMADMLERVVARWHPHFAVSPDGTTEARPMLPEIVRRSPLLEVLGRLTPWESGDSIAVPRAIHVAADRVVRARGAYPLFVLTNYQKPCLPDASGRPSIEGLLYDGLPLQHVRVDLDPAAIVSTNGHPDASAHARMAEAVVKALRDARVAPR